MNTYRSLLLVAVIVAVVIAYFVTRTPLPLAPPVGPVESMATAKELVGTAVPEPNADVVQRSLVAEGSSDAAAVAARRVLRVILEGSTDEDARLTTVTLTGPAEIRASWPCRGSASEFDLDPLFASAARREGLHVDELQVEVDHPLCLPEKVRVPLSRGVEEKAGRTVYEVRVRLAAAGVIHGRLVREDGAPAAAGMVGALLLEESTRPRPTTGDSPLAEVPVEGEGRAVECAVDGAFELRLAASGRYVLASFEEGRRPTTTWVEAVVGRREDVGTIKLEPGHAITGQVLRHGMPLTGARVALAPPEVFWAADPADAGKGMNAWIRPWRTFECGARSVRLVWFEGRFELAGDRVGVDDNGAFAFGGLAPCEYRLRVVELRGSRFLPNGWDNPAMGDEGPDEMVVRAPANGIVLQFNWTSIRFELEGDREREAEGRMVLKTRSLYPGNQHIHIPEYWSTQLDLSGTDPVLVLQAPASKQILGEVTFPGRQPVQLDFRTPEPGGELVIPVRLARAPAPATLVIGLENPQPEIPARFVVMLRRAGQESDPDTRPVEIVAGQLRVADIVPGRYRVTVCAGEDPNHSGLFFRDECELELPAGQVITRSVRMKQGAGLRLTLRDENGESLRGQYEFYDGLGNRATLCLVDKERWRPGSDQWATLSELGLGTYESSGAIEPGSYRIVLI
ncbi:MAG: hypothetical protein KDC98_05355 [Planctomycetes bacterium]|nr:hypothetical protein [Planctomycetota bacterium]